MTLEQWNVLGTWVAGLGTVSAVIVSLWLAYSRDKLKLLIFVGERNIISPGSGTPPIEVLNISITNCSLRPVTITHVSWRTGIRNKKLFIQLFNVPGYPTLPTKLEDGARLDLIVPYQIPSSTQSYTKELATDLFKNCMLPEWNVWLLKCLVTTSVGQTFVIRPESNFRKRLISDFRR